MSLNGRIPSLDGFRAISIFLVIFCHVILLGPIYIKPSTFFLPSQVGILGVRIFFVISGFLITYLLLKERERTGKTNLKSFYIRRALRILPVFYVYLGVLAILNLLLHLNIGLHDFLIAGFFVQNFWLDTSNWFTGHSWSLGVEEQFYILWPLIFVRAGILKKWWVLISILAFGTFMRSFNYKFPQVAEYFFSEFFMYSDFLFSGCFMAYLLVYSYESVTNFINKINSSFVYLSIIAIWFLTNLEFHPTYDIIFIPLSGTVINVCICFLILYFIVKKDSLGYRLLNLPAIRFIGHLSYSLYIWQQLFLSRSHWIFDFPQNILFTFLAALASYYLVEKPFLKLKEMFKPSVDA